jgi:hypothetical protein
MIAWMAVCTPCPLAGLAAEGAAAPAEVARLVESLGTPRAEGELEAMAEKLAPLGDEAVPTIDAVLAGKSPLARSAAAELLWRIACKNRLSPGGAALAARLLDSHDPFARGLAEWAIAVKVGMENNRPEAVWPGSNPPDWFRRWSALAPERFIEADYVRTAVGWQLHHDPRSLAGSAGKILSRARSVAAEIRQSGDADRQAAVAGRLEAVESICRRLAERDAAAPDDLVSLRSLWLAARLAARPIVLANPAVDFNQIVFVQQHAGHSLRNITGSQYPWTHKPGGDICVKAGLDPQDAVRGVIEGRLGPGHVHGIDLWWDADRVVFGYAVQKKWPPKWDTGPQACPNVFDLRGDQEPTHVYEVGLDGSGLRQLTDHPYWSDFEPTYLPDGDVAFASDRSGRSSECGKFVADHTVINIYALARKDGTIRRLSDNKDIDRYPHTLQSGLVGYTRWEYQERHFFEVHAIWTVRPDGTQSDAVFNQHLKAPYSLRDTRSVPGSSKLVSIAAGHHTLAYGPVVLVDPSLGPNAPEAIRNVTPYTVPQEGPPPGAAVAEGGVPDKGGLYHTPWALSENCFLVSYSHNVPPYGSKGAGDTGFAVYLIDVYGDKELVHRDLVYSCTFPMPLRRRARPVVPADATDPAQGWATCYVGDIYSGMPGVERGTVKHIRISQRVGWPLDQKIGAMRYIPGNAWENKFGYWAWSPVRVIGTVPVDDDGSASFRVPVDEAVYFQALDENFMEVRRMRSHVTFQPGEVRGCLGCHETKPKTPHAAWPVATALAREPDVPQPPAWGADRLLGYEWLVQPILDRNCVRCHGPERADGGIDLSGAPTEDGFCRSFETLFGRRAGGEKPAVSLVSVSNRFDGAAVTQPKQFGSHRSRLVEVLLEDDLHQKESKLDRADWIALVTWIDANAPYHDTFYNRRPADGGDPRREIELTLPGPFALNRQ